MTERNRISGADHEHTWGASEEAKREWNFAHPVLEDAEEEPLPGQAETEPGPTYDNPNA